jgi:alpha-tubulin suppressor-like RCC1 family protein
VVSAGGPLGGLVEIEAGPTFACAASAGGAWCWGDNTTGALGDATTTSRGLAAPVLLPPGDVVDLRVGLSFACAIVGADVLCWGANRMGQLGRPLSEVPDHDPTPASTAANPRVPLQLGAGAEHMCVREENGDVFCWGSNEFGKLGPGTSTPFSFRAVRPLGDTRVVDLAVGALHSCALTNDNRVLCWGGAARGRLGGEKPSIGAVVRAKIACGAAAP